MNLEDYISAERLQIYVSIRMNEPIFHIIIFNKLSTGGETTP
ncbi:Uncharacterised protein [Yersinia similis]|nr:Uncharacterised protein [Yersinia similis]CNB98886.1 Uncharacterised protein [Yersinia similis]